jgi:aldehyde dehydrogenase (NAD+)
VGVNLTLVHYTQLNLPFGGVNTSGNGAAHGQAGFRAFSHDRAVMRNRFLPLPLVFPPYTPRVMRLIGLVKRAFG